MKNAIYIHLSVRHHPGMAISFDFVHDTFEKIPIRLNSIVYQPSLYIQFFWLIKIFWARTVIQERNFRLL